VNHHLVRAPGLGSQRAKGEENRLLAMFATGGHQDLPVWEMVTEKLAELFDSLWVDRDDEPAQPGEAQERL
jgi:hypothetical protein